MIVISNIDHISNLQDARTPLPTLFASPIVSKVVRLLMTVLRVVVSLLLKKTLDIIDISGMDRSHKLLASSPERSRALTPRTSSYALLVKVGFWDDIFGFCNLRNIVMRERPFCLETNLRYEMYRMDVISGSGISDFRRENSKYGRPEA